MQQVKKAISTKLGNLTYFESGNAQGKTLIFLHGVFFDHMMWNFMAENLSEYRCILVDMPNHGDSQTLLNWNLNIVAETILEILNTLDLNQVTLIGHSWGSMTALRVAAQNSSKISGLILFNCPMNPPDFSARLTFNLQLLLAGFSNFYGREAAKALLGKSYTDKYPDEISQIQTHMKKMGAKVIRYTIRKVILESDGGYPYYNQVKNKLPIQFVSADEDYTRLSSPKETLVLKGGHVSPVIQKQASLEIIQSFLQHK